MKIIKKIKMGNMLDVFIKDCNFYIGSESEFNEFLENVKLDFVEMGCDEVFVSYDRNVPFACGNCFDIYCNSIKRTFYYEIYFDENGKYYEFFELR